MSNLKIYMIGVLILGNISLSFGVVYLEHLTRTKYRELQSLSNEKYNDFKQKFDFDVGIITGDNKINMKNIQKQNHTKDIHLIIYYLYQI
jgi:hypothetical protein